LALNHIEFNVFIITNTAQVFLGIILLDCSLMNENVFVCIVAIDETIAISYIEPFNGASDFFSYYVTSFI